MLGCSGTRPRDIGLVNGRLRPCPETPNCVSSEEGTPEQARVAPFPAPGGATDVARMSLVVIALPRTVVDSQPEGYLYAQSTSLIFRFVDDLELRYDSLARVIQVRSASRIGRSDLGANRRRVEQLRERWLAALSAAQGSTPPR